MNVLEAIQARRAVRAYTTESVDDGTIHRLLDAAVLAPNAMNEQTWLFAVNPRLVDPSFNIFYDAGTLVVIAASSRGTHTDADCWLAAENLMLAACEMGLGSCPIGFAVPLLNTRQVKEELELSESAVVVAPVIIGHPRTPAPAVPRSRPKISAWIR